MFWFWSIIAIVFLILELNTLTFGFIFITIGSLIVSLLLALKIITNSDILYQLLIILFFAVTGFCIFYKTFKKLKTVNKDNFKEDMKAIVIEKDLKKGTDGKIKWSGTIFNATISHNSKFNIIPINSIVIIEEFKGNVAIINKIS